MIDASIPLGVKPVQIESPLNALAQMMQVQGLQSQNQMNALKMDEYKRSVEDQAGLRTDLSAPGADPYNVLLKRGKVKEATEFQNSQSKNAHQDVETEHKAIGIYRDASQSITDPQSAAAFVTTMHTDPRLKNSPVSRVPLEQLLAKIPQDPAQLAAWKQEFALGATKFMELNKPSIHMQDTGGASNVVSVPGLGGAPTVLSSTPITQSENNKATVGASYANANATREVAKATREAAQINSNQNTEMKLGDDWRTQSKNFKETADAYKQISAVLDKATTSPAATLAGATKFMKMIDPGSVVRESELGMALAATGVFDRAANYYNTLKNGKVLTASQVADFKNITKQINDAASKQQKLIDGHFGNIAKQYGLRPEMVVQDYGQNAVDAPAGGAPAGFKVLGVEK